MLPSFVEFTRFLFSYSTKPGQSQPPLQLCTPVPSHVDSTDAWPKQSDLTFFCVTPSCAFLQESTTETEEGTLCLKRPYDRVLLGQVWRVVLVFDLVVGVLLGSVLGPTFSSLVGAK